MPSQKRRQEIEKIVDKITCSDNLFIPGFDLTKFLTEKYGFVIGVQPLDKNTTGILIVDDDNYILNTQSHKLISVNTNLGASDEYIYNLKKRFIIAHEFAHYMLHKKDNTQFAHRDSDKKENLEEKEADYFARCLLMPRKLIEDALNVGNINEQNLCTKASVISRLFAVTIKKAKMRIEELGLA